MKLDPSTRNGNFLRRAALAAIVLWLATTALPGVAVAQEAADSGGKAHMHNALSYGLVIFVIALGLLILCRPANRKRVEGGPAVGGLFSLGKSESEGPAPGQPMRKKPHRGPLLLILSIVGIPCCIIALVSYSMANTDLDAMHTGRMDRSGEGLTKAAKYVSLAAIILGLINVLINVVVILVMATSM